MTTIRSESLKRVKAIDFGSPVTNICAGEKNPSRHAYFVRSGKGYVTCTDKKGRFWDTDIDVIHPGHLPYDQCEMLFAPVWNLKFGHLKTTPPREPGG